jgi:hypothetical protein
VAASVSGTPARAAASIKAFAEIGLLEALLAIADAELDAEIDAQADEEHGKCDRDEVERPTIINPSAAVIDKPMNSAITTATMIRNDFNAIHRINSTTVEHKLVCDHSPVIRVLV